MNHSTTSASPILRGAWDRFHASVDEMRELMEQTPRFRDRPQHRAKAYHSLLEAQAMAYNFAVGPRMLHPRIHINTGWQTDLYTLGQNGPDFNYGVLFVDGRQTYRLSGRYGDVVLFLMQVHSGIPGQKDVKPTGSYDFSEFELGAGERFEVILSASPHPGNWVPLDHGSPYQFILTRRAMRDWSDDPGEFRIDRISELADDFYDDEEFDEAAMAHRIDLATDYLHYIFKRWNVNLYEMYLGNADGQKNRMSLLPGTVTSQVGASLSNYCMAIFELADDEAAIIEMDTAPDGVYWSFQLGDVWSRSLNFTSRQTTINMHHGVIDADGGFRAVVSRRDPGIANWLDTTGREEGTVVFRNYRAGSAPVPTMRKLKFADLAGELPSGTLHVTPEQRQQALRRRRDGFLKLHGE